MHRRKRVVGLSLAVGLLLGTVSCAKSDTGATGGVATTAPGGPGGASGSGDAATVQMKGTKFNPTSITVRAGQKLTFKNDDPTAHEPIAGTVEAPQEGVMHLTVDANASGTTSLSGPGTVQYFCRIHPSMKGTITVS